MNCPHCEQEMNYQDYYGLGIPGRNDFKKIGDIYKCQNEECEVFDTHFHTNNSGGLREGYPC